jgi:hypothetical protein
MQPSDNIDRSKNVPEESAGTRQAVKTGRLSRPIVLITIIAVCLLFFGFTTPKSVPSVMLIVGFLMLAALIYSFLKLVFIISGLNARMPSVYSRGIMLAGTLIPVLLLMLQSIGQLTVRDVLTLSGLFIIGIFYVGRVRRSGAS